MDPAAAPALPRTPSRSMQAIVEAGLLTKNILPFLPNKCTFIRMAATCKTLGVVMASDSAEELWKCVNLTVCIDPACPLCPYKRESSKQAVFSILQKFPISYGTIHCLVLDIPAIIKSVGLRGTMKSLHIALTNKKDTPQLSSLLEGVSIIPDAFKALHALTIDSSNLRTVGLQGRIKILSMVGRQLNNLELIGTCASGIFDSIREYCPNLKHLRVDKVETEGYLSQYDSSVLLSLELRRVGFLPMNLAYMTPALQQLKLTFNCFHGEAQWIAFFGALPRSLKSIELEIPSSLGNLIISLIASTTPQIEEVRLGGSYDSSAISRSSIEELVSKCNRLAAFELGGAFSAFQLLMDRESILALCRRPSLRELTLMYRPADIDAISRAMLVSESIRRVVLWERRRWVSPQSIWSDMKARVDEINVQFPAVEIELQDRSDRGRQ
jgi:hypothetical protein